MDTLLLYIIICNAQLQHDGQYIHLLNSLFLFVKVPETEDESNSPSEFQEFSNMLINAQKVADKAGKAHFFTWKGYRACVASQLPKFNTIELSRRYKLAIQCLKADKKEFFESSQLSSASGRSSSSSSSSSKGSLSILSDEPPLSQELTQIPATQLQGIDFFLIFSCLFKGFFYILVYRELNILVYRELNINLCLTKRIFMQHVIKMYVFRCF